MSKQQNTQNQEIPMIAVNGEVRDLVQGITMQEYSDERLLPSLEFGSSEVCLQTNKFTWPVTDPQYHRARTAANYFAASDLLPKTLADRDTGMPLYLTYSKIAMGIVARINEGLPGDDDSAVIIIKSTGQRNHYLSPETAEPFMVQSGYGGKRYHNQTDNIGVERL